MKLTTYFRLQKPEIIDPVNVDDLNNNADAIDSEMHDLANGANAVSFTQATARANITAGETIAVILGKIAKFFADLKTVAFTGSFNDLTDRPTITGLQSINNDTTTVAGYVADARIAKTHGDEIDAIGKRTTTAEGNITALQAKSYNLANNLVTTAEGSCLDARQGKVLDDKISTINGNINVYVGSDDKIHFMNGSGADSVLPFSNSKIVNVGSVQLIDEGTAGSDRIRSVYFYPMNTPVTEVVISATSVLSVNNITIVGNDGTLKAVHAGAWDNESVDLGTGTYTPYVALKGYTSSLGVYANITLIKFQ